jgi:hypothetical protein
MTQTHFTTSADYADSLLTARKAKGALTLLLLLVLLSQLALFFSLRYWKPLPVAVTEQQQHVRDVIQYVVGLLDFGGLILPALLSVVLLIILQVQLVGRLLGTGRMTSALIWSALLVILLFPWQAVLNNPAINADPTANALGMKIPGVIYTWAEISNPVVGATFNTNAIDTKPDLLAAGLHWARYVAFPLLTILILTNIHFKTRKSLQQSLGEDQIVDTTTPSV